MASIAYALYLAYRVLRLDEGTDAMRRISLAIREGASAYLKRQNRTVLILLAILAVVFTVALPAPQGQTLNWQAGLSTVLGGLLSALAGFIGMFVAVRANVRTANKAKEGLAAALSVAFKGGAVTGLMVVGLAILGLSLLFILFGNPTLLVGFGFGASLVSLFARVGGGIYTKAADVGADLVGKVEAGIPEDDPRNPAVIADNVGDNVGDCAGMAADLFETYVVTALATMLLAFTPIVQNKFGSNAVLLPLAIGAVAIFATIAGTFFVRLGRGGGIMTALYKGVVATTIVSAVGFFFINNFLMAGNIGIYIAALVGLVVMAFMVVNSEIFTSMKFGSVKMVARESQTGAATNVIAGLGIGLRSTLPPTIVIVVGILVSFYLGGGFEDPVLGIFGVSIAAAAMLSTTGMIVAIDAYGPITDNAGGIAEMAGLPKEVRDVTDPLDAVGNTTKAVTKGYAIGSAALAALSLFAVYREEVTLAAGEALGPIAFSLDNPLVLVGLLLGAAIPFFFSSSLMLAVGKAASDVVKEVRRQFRELPGIMDGSTRPEYGKCVDIVTRSAMRELAIPALVAVAAPLIVGFVLGPIALGGLLLGIIISGLLLALLMTTGGATWDNAKKFIEAGNYGGKKTPTHAAAVVGDTVGDPFKDTAGPSINPLIKVVNMIAILFVVLIVNNNLISLAG